MGGNPKLVRRSWAVKTVPDAVPCGAAFRECRQPASGIGLKEGVPPAVTEVELGRECNQQHGEIEVRQVERGGEFAERGYFDDRGKSPETVIATKERHLGTPREKTVNFLLTDVQA